MNFGPNVAPLIPQIKERSKSHLGQVRKLIEIYSTNQGSLLE
jgi:hypothetical protein